MAAAGAAHCRSGNGSRSATLLVLVSAVLVSVLSACGARDDNPYGLTEFGGAGSPAQAASRSGAGGGTAGTGPASSTVAAPSAVQGTSGPVMQVVRAPEGALTYSPSDIFAEGAWVERGAIVAVTAARKAVVDAAMAFMATRVQLSNTWQVDEPALTAVASGQALANMRDRAEVQRAAERRSVGPFVLNLASVKVSGGRAIISGCSYDGTVEVSTLGSVVSDPAGGVELTMDLQRRDDQWRVTTFPTEKTFCQGPGR